MWSRSLLGLRLAGGLGCLVGGGDGDRRMLEATLGTGSGVVPRVNGDWIDLLCVLSEMDAVRLLLSPPRKLPPPRLRLALDNL